MNAPIQIRNAGVVKDIRELADRTHLPITEAVARVVRAEIDRLRSDDAERIAAQLKAVEEIVERVRNLPKIGPMLTDDDLYDELGLPR